MSEKIPDTYIYARFSVCVCVCVCLCMYVYIYSFHPREMVRFLVCLSLPVCVCMHLYTHTAHAKWCVSLWSLSMLLRSQHPHRKTHRCIEYLEKKTKQKINHVAQEDAQMHRLTRHLQKRQSPGALTTERPYRDYFSEWVQKYFAPITWHTFV